jgi:hypothetical protein
MPDTTVRHTSCGGTVHFERRRVPSIPTFETRNGHQVRTDDDKPSAVLVCDQCRGVLSVDQISNGPVVGLSGAA